MLRLSALIVFILSILLGGAVKADAHDTVGPVEAVSCSTSKTGVTKVKRIDGSVQRFRNLTVQQRRTAFHVKSADLLVWASRPNHPVIIHCRVNAAGAVMLRTEGGARWRVWQTPAPVAPAPVAPEGDPGTPPAVVGTWDGPVTLSASGVDLSWRLAEAVAAWNLALTEAHKVVLSSEPCEAWTPDSRCITVALEGGEYLGVAYQSFAEGRMQACSIGLNPVTPVEYRPFVAVHELGHCLGLPHWDVRSVMSSTTPTDLPTEQDLAWLSSAYAVTP